MFVYSIELGLPVRRRASPGSTEFKFFCCISRPLGAMAGWEILGLYSSEDLELLEWNVRNFWSFSLGSVGEPSFPLSSSQS